MADATKRKVKISILIKIELTPNKYAVTPYFNMVQISNSHILDKIYYFTSNFLILCMDLNT